MYFKKFPDSDVFNPSKKVDAVDSKDKLINCSHRVLCMKPGKSQVHKDKKPNKAKPKIPKTNQTNKPKKTHQLKGQSRNKVSNTITLHGIGRQFFLKVLSLFTSVSFLTTANKSSLLKTSSLHTTRDTWQ